MPAESHDVVDHERRPPLDVADHVHRLDVVVGAATLVHHRDPDAEALAKGPGAFDPPGIGGDHDERLGAEAPNEVDHHRRGEEMIDGYVEVALNLPHVEIHGDDPVRARDSQQIRDELRRNRDPGPILPVLTGVAIVGNHRVDARRRGPFQRVHHEEQLHQVLVHRRAGGLDHEHVGAPDVVVDLKADLPVAKPVERHGGEGLIEVVRDPADERGVRGPAEDLQIAGEADAPGRSHQFTPATPQAGAEGFEPS